MKKQTNEYEHTFNSREDHMKKFIDEKFLLNKWKYISQCLIVTFFFWIILLMLDLVMKTAIVASLGATCFIIFTIPNKNASKASYIIGGYSVGIVVGGICSLGLNFTHNLPLGLWGAAAIGLSMFFMVILNFEHPPATALALGLVTEGYYLRTILIVFLISGILLFVRRILKHWLIDLI